MDKSDIDWLRKVGFRKQNNQPHWFVIFRDAREDVKGRCPFFDIEVVFSETHGWSCRVAANKIVQAIWLEVATEKSRADAAFPDYWRERHYIDLGYACGADSAMDAVRQAVGIAYANIRNITDKEVYNIEDLNRELGG